MQQKLQIIKAHETGGIICSYNNEEKIIATMNKDKFERVFELCNVEIKLNVVYYVTGIVVNGDYINSIDSVSLTKKRKIKYSDMSTDDLGLLYSNLYNDEQKELDKIKEERSKILLALTKKEKIKIKRIKDKYKKLKIEMSVEITKRIY